MMHLRQVDAWRHLGGRSDTMCAMTSDAERKQAVDLFVAMVERVARLAARVDTTEIAIEEQTRKVSGLRPTVGVGDFEAVKEAAILDALSSRALGVREEMAAVELIIALKDATRALTTVATDLNHEISTFTTKADEGTNRLATWTMMLAIVTAFLVAGALAQAWVTWSAAPQVIVVPSVKP
jgi:hypothetical protein